jgi:hypothetical protein
MIGRYLDRCTKVGGDLPAVALNAGPDVARNPDELQFPGGVVYAVDYQTVPRRGVAVQGRATPTRRLCAAAIRVHEEDDSTAPRKLS